MKEEFLDYVEDIIEAMNDAQTFVKNLDFDSFVKDKKNGLCPQKSLRNNRRGHKTNSRPDKRSLS